jgi:hypothetical protein
MENSLGQFSEANHKMKKGKQTNVQAVKNIDASFFKKIINRNKNKIQLRYERY